MKLLALLLSTLALSSCGPTIGRLNPDPLASPVSRVAPSAFPDVWPVVILGDYNPASGAIRLRSTFQEPFTLAHELRHLADHRSITYAQAIAFVTPAAPTPEFSRMLAVCWEVERSGGSWQTIKDRWGPTAVAHADILATLH